MPTNPLEFPVYLKHASNSKLSNLSCVTDFASLAVLFLQRKKRLSDSEARSASLELGRCRSMGDTVESFGPAPIGDSWEETFEEPAPLRPNFLELRQLNQEKQEREAKRAERRAKLMGGMLQNMSIGAYEPPPVDDRPDSDERKEQESSPTTWYTATDE